MAVYLLQTLKTSISQQPQSNLGWRNAPYPSGTYAAIPRARGILPRQNKTGRPNPGTSNSDTCRISETKVSEHKFTTVRHTETTTRSGHYGCRPGPAHYYRVVCRQWEQAAAGQGWSPHPETEASGKHKKKDIWIPLGPTFANICMCFYESTWLSDCPAEFKPIFYRRYIDDTFLLLRHKDHSALFLD